MSLPPGRSGPCLFDGPLGVRPARVLGHCERSSCADPIRAVARSVLKGFDFQPTLASQNAHEPPHGVLLPSSHLHNLGERHALRPLHHGDDLGLLVAALRSLARLLWCCGFLPRLGLLGRFALLSRFRALSNRLGLCCFLFGTTGLRSNRLSRAGALFIITYVVHRFLLAASFAVTH